MTTELLSCDLTPDEVRERGEEAARKAQERDTIEAERQSSQKSYKGRVESLEGQVRHLLSEVRSKSTRREIEVISEARHDAGMMETIRTDTGEIVRSRPLTANERQTSLFPAERAKKGEDVHAE